MPQFLLARDGEKTLALSSFAEGDSRTLKILNSVFSHSLQALAIELLGSAIYQISAEVAVYNQLNVEADLYGEIEVHAVTKDTAAHSLGKGAFLSNKVCCTISSA